jgi:phosphoribosylformylglycinamidine synthase
MAEIYEELGLTKDEYEKINKILGRKPNLLELAMYSVMWSEHCAYKYSRLLLKLLPTEGPHILQGPGENAGIVDIGDGLAIVFKMESHNHPSAIEPFQGAATGVGGILRDIFTMGARPIALLDPLRFGSLDNPRVKYLFEEVVAGISAYGNCVGVPTVGGDVYFEDAYQGNPLVNVMCIGIAQREHLIKGLAEGQGNIVLLIGSKTGRDGIGGVSILASREFEEGAEEKRPSVQVGDPFTEKLLIEACLDLLEKNLLVGLQDLGGAGLTCATCETASRAGTGMDVDVSKVLRREEKMQPFETMISESQERMLAIISPNNLDEALQVCTKWGLDATQIGKVTETGLLRIFEDGKLVGEMPARSLAHDAPVYYGTSKKPDYIENVQNYDLSQLKAPEDLNEALMRILSAPNICSRHWVYEQYDHMVQTNTAVLPGSDAAILRIKGTKKAVAATTDCNGRYCYLDPYVGAQIAVAEAARNLVCSGAKPLAVTDCLNFGSPEKPHVFWQFEQAIKGLSLACVAFETPVVGGNVSFYNESFGEAIYPTPIVGMVGLIDDASHRCTAAFQNEGDLIVLLGETYPEIGGSEYLKVIFDLVVGTPPYLSMEREKRVQECCLEAIREGLILSAHDCSEGGIAAALAECCITGGRGAIIEVQGSRFNVQEGIKSVICHLSSVDWLFSESQSRIIVSLKEADMSKLQDIAISSEVPITVLGRTGGNRLLISDKIDLAVEAIARNWQGALECMIKS